MKLHWRMKLFLAGIGLVLPLWIVCGLTPAVAYVPAQFGNSLCWDEEHHSIVSCDAYTNDDGLMFQVWQRDLARWITETDWGLSLLNLGKAVLVIGAVLAGLVGVLLCLGALVNDADPANEDSTKK